jgi:hypothetical protein
MLRPTGGGEEKSFGGAHRLEWLFFPAAAASLTGLRQRR